MPLATVAQSITMMTMVTLAIFWPDNVCLAQDPSLSSAPYDDLVFSKDLIDLLAMSLDHQRNGNALRTDSDPDITGPVPQDKRQELRSSLRIMRKRGWIDDSPLRSMRIMKRPKSSRVLRRVANNNGLNYGYGLNRYFDSLRVMKRGQATSEPTVQGSLRIMKKPNMNRHESLRIMKKNDMLEDSQPYFINYHHLVD